MKIQRQTAVLFALAAVGLAFGCGGGGGGGRRSGSTIAPITTAPVTTGTAPITTGTAPITTGVAPVVTTTPPVVVVPPSRYVYSANFSTNTVTPFTIDKTTGVPKPSASVPSASGTWAIAAHPSGKFLYVLGSSTISSFAIDDATGNLAAIGGQTVTLTGTTWYIGCDPTGAFAFVTASDTLYSLKVDQTTGALSNAGSVTIAGAGLREMVCDPTGKFVYVAGSTGANVTCVAVEAGTGNLKTASTAMSLASSRPIAMDPSGKFVFVGSSSSTVKAVQSFSRDTTTGALTKIGSPAPCSGPVYGVTVSPDGKYVYAACDENFTTKAPSGVSQFKLDIFGNLAPLTPPTAAGGDWPLGIVVDASGSFAFVPDYFRDTITAFKVDTKTGLMTVNGAPVSVGNVNAAPHGIAIVK
jgi:6-phosphogluconolactonase